MIAADSENTPRKLLLPWKQGVEVYGKRRVYPFVSPALRPGIAGILNLSARSRRKFLPENTHLITIEELRVLQDDAWTAKPSEKLASQDILLWHAAWV